MRVVTERKQYVLSVMKCRQLDLCLPYVEAHNRYRFTRERRENSATQTLGGGVGGE